jgi:transposase
MSRPTLPATAARYGNGRWPARPRPEGWPVGRPYSRCPDYAPLHPGYLLYLHGGFDALLAPERRAVPQALSATRRKVLHHILLHKLPADYGQDGYQWTGKRAQSLIKQKWGIHLGLGRIHQLFHQFGLSHQRAHRDYGPSSPGKRSAFVADLKKNSRTAAGWRTRGAG